MSIVLITGCSSGFGLAAALAFSRRGDTVIATVRDLAKAQHLSSVSDNLDVACLEVTDPGSRIAVVNSVLTRHGSRLIVIDLASAAWLRLVNGSLWGVRVASDGV